MNTPEFQAALQTVSKAIAGAIVGAIIALAARFGFNTDETTANALDVIVTIILGTATGYVGVYLAHKNKESK